jgi:hypothetical protein
MRLVLSILLALGLALVLVPRLAACTNPVPYPAGDASIVEPRPSDAANDACVPIRQTCQPGVDVCCAGVCVATPGSGVASCTVE